MSIIYEALKKTQNKRSEAQEFIEPQKINNALKVRSYSVILMGILSFLVIVNIFQYFYHAYAAKRPSAQVSQAPVIAEDEIFKNKHKLSGVFLSTNEKVAMIDNKFYYLGSSIDGMKLVKMKLNQVTLRDEKMSINLEVAEY